MVFFRLSLFSSKLPCSRLVGARAQAPGENLGPVLGGTTAAFIVKGLVLVILVIALYPPASRAQSTYTAASCSQAAILAAYNAEQVSPADGDIIAIPAGSCTWTGNSTLQTSFTTSVTVQGAGAISASAGGASTTGTDNTIITDHFSGGASRWILTCAAGKTCRVTGIAFYQDLTSVSVNGGVLLVNGSGSRATTWRVDHIHAKIKSGNPGVYVGGPGSAVIGVADHNFFEPGIGQTSGLTNNYAFHNGYGWNGGSTSDVNTSWRTAPNWGSNQFFFVEDNYMHNTDMSDGSEGSRYVIRHNNSVCDVAQQSGCQLFSHTTREGERGDFAREVYANTFSQNPGVGNAVVPINSGVALVWGNTANGYGQVANLDNQRQYSEDFQFKPIPTGLGYCGPAPYVRGTASVAANSTQVTGSGFSTNWCASDSNLLMIITGATCVVSSPNASKAATCPVARVNSSSSITLLLPSTTAATNGIFQVGSPWDGNANVTGYPCLDQPGRALGDLLSGQTNSNLLNTTTGTQTWPHQVLTPVYVWNNTFTPAGVNGPVIVQGTPGNPSHKNFTNNVDYYMQFSAYGNSGSFNGTTGVGEGLLSARPATCTAGTDPKTGGSALGVGYWATDTNTLYVCNPTNTWTAYYTPYTYPHPLNGGASGASVNPPTGLAATVQ
jgi:hypothetical protein